MNDPRIDKALEAAVAAGEVGVQVAAYLDGELVVDACTGAADEHGTAMTPDHLNSIFSASKGMLATLCHLFAERGLLDLDAPVADAWPEYAQRGKGGITPRHVMTHQAGVPQMPEDLTTDRLDDWEWIIERLAAIEPLQPPGEANNYHAISIYYLLGEVLTRTDPQHRPYWQLFREELCTPLGVADAWFQLPAEQEHRVAPLTWGPAGPPPGIEAANAARIDVPPAYTPTIENYNSPRMHSAAASNMLINARSGARFWSLIANFGEVDGLRLLSHDRVAAFTQPRPNDARPDALMGVAWGWTTAGYHHGGAHPMGPIVGESLHMIGHGGGGGGSVGWADLDTGMSAMITHNRAFSGPQPFAELGAVLREIAAERRGGALSTTP
jgi:CubicO group peptidase (beta-lactamase class C family)